MRNDAIDTAKAGLIFLVVLGHFLERMIGWSQASNQLLLETIYAIHMPAFIFISGMLYKDKNWLKNLIFFIALYVPFQLLYLASDAVMSGQWHWSLFERPYWLMWYLMGMMAWTLFMHVFHANRFALVLAALIALGIGFSPWNNYAYSIGRICVFLPFFVLGYRYGQPIMQKLQQQNHAVLWASLSLGFIVLILYWTNLSQFWWYGSLSYAQLKVDIWQGSLTRIACLLLSSWGVLTLLVLFQHLGTCFMRLGQNTLPVYLLHGFVVIWLARMIQLNLPVAVEVLVCVVLSILTCVLLQQRIFDQSIRQLSQWLLRPTHKLWQK
ncbi:acyltransferase family protein [Acinetobacter tibetensis]|uniref:Acyltransferase family protein n=1 Tax=Acinetobacter tibetensis TaxID=2943497 RepID=A0AAE9LQW4_9GAMM|nr:acyltransferase family protein [Acinetobacter tibetensis]USE82870.1 acyltransferase family protein [Acinetobacter tibetensis]